MLDINEGGRDTGYFDGDRLQFYFKTTDVTGEIQLPIEIDMAMLKTLDITIELIQPIKITEEEPLSFVMMNVRLDWEEFLQSSSNSYFYD